jgi:hypothetical protein
VHDFESEVPAPLHDFLTAPPQWLDKISLMAEAIVMPPSALEAFVRWALCLGDISSVDLVAFRREDLRQQTPPIHTEAPQ